MPGRFMISWSVGSVGSASAIRYVHSLTEMPFQEEWYEIALSADSIGETLQVRRAQWAQRNCPNHSPKIRKVQFIVYQVHCLEVTQQTAMPNSNFNCTPTRNLMPFSVLACVPDPKHRWVSRRDRLYLAALLAAISPATRELAQGTMCNTATRVLKKAYESETDYGDAVKECLNWTRNKGEAFQDPQFEESVFDVIPSRL
ncbi:hypothetical protein BO94DRAFT_547951 [Aspergillus sclerotioniger CBS 115572]|uniref:Uncharacterized protein n=1 Tax=Aspergillus sclerotioniger CBS 115572 TaxID=1450535 RepID=A0A317W8W2_9EURO|nr:hypothetical protein BO94DRAFT_547951 [Aspergillus sclerotioniger CBS 115572]PWY81682.1 hypothetical protein BO94DRAFT_547951 [Aspergillus sclerotioniger CBS 115572]